MRRRSILPTVLIGLLALVPRAQAQPAPRAGAPLSAGDRAVGGKASILAADGPRQAVRWLRAQRRVVSARLGPDGATVDVRFRDGGELLIVPGAERPSRSARLRPLVDLPGQRDDPSPAARKAAVLMPFANELGLGSDAGDAEVAMLQRAGFAVDVFRNTDVTVRTMEGLAQYSVVYDLTHAAVLPNGDAVVVVDETDTHPYTDLFKEHALFQALVSGDSKTLYIAIASPFVQDHMGTFPNGALLFFNGCSLLRAPLFWNALQSKNVATLISWDHDVYKEDNTAAGAFIMTRLSEGESVAAALADAQAAGVATRSVDSQVTKLGFLGDGDASLARALTGTAPVPTPVPTATPSPTPIPTARPQPTSKPAQHKHKKHKKKVVCTRDKHGKKHCKAKKGT